VKLSQANPIQAAPGASFKWWGLYLLSFFANGWEWNTGCTSANFILILLEWIVSKTSDSHATKQLLV
jgi:hypothetical protein